MKNIHSLALFAGIASLSLMGCSKKAPENQLEKQAGKRPEFHHMFFSAVGWDTFLYVNGEPVARGGYFNSNGVKELTPWLKPGDNAIRMVSRKLDSDKREIDAKIVRMSAKDPNVQTTLGGITKKKADKDVYETSFTIQNAGNFEPILWLRGDMVGALTKEDKAAITAIVTDAADALSRKNGADFRKNQVPLWGEGEPPAGLLPEGMDWAQAEGINQKYMKEVFGYADYTVKIAPLDQWEWTVGSKVVMISLAPPKEYPADADKDYGLEIVKAWSKEKRGQYLGLGNTPQFIKLRGKWVMLSKG